MSRTDRSARLAAWSVGLGASLHPSVEIYYDDVTQNSLRVRKATGAEQGDAGSLEPGQVVVSCPLSTTLSYLNALTGGPIKLDEHPLPEVPTPAFPDRFMEVTPPHVIGRFFLIQQYLLGSQSYWAPYIESLQSPQHIPSWRLPAFWPEDLLSVLDGTNAHVAAAEIRANVSQEFKKAKRTLKELGYPGWQDYTALLYRWSFCVFTSRSFRPSLVVSAEAKRRLAPRLPEGVDFDDFSILLPLFDLANHSPVAKACWDASADPKGVQLKFEHGYAPGEQIFNNYGPKTNSELLLGYGFTLPATPDFHNDYVHLRKREEQTTETEANPKKPRDFLLSLRPMNDPSSVVGRSRQLPRSSPQRQILTGFDRFEDGLLYDMCTTFWSPAEQEALEADMRAETGDNSPPLREGDLVDRAFDADLESKYRDLAERIRQPLADKLASDYQRLVDTQHIVDEMPPQEGPEHVAVQYRKQCAKVLRDAIRALDPSVRLPSLGLWG